MVRRLSVHPLFKAASDLGERRVEFSSSEKEIGNQLIKGDDRFGGLRRMFANVNAAAFAEFDPLAARELAISSADGIRMNVEAACEFTGAGETLARLEVCAQNAEDNLRYQLLANAD